MTQAFLWAWLLSRVLLLAWTCTGISLTHNLLLHNPYQAHLNAVCATLERR